MLGRRVDVLMLVRDSHDSNTTEVTHHLMLLTQPIAYRFHIAKSLSWSCSACYMNNVPTYALDDLHRTLNAS